MIGNIALKLNTDKFRKRYLKKKLAYLHKELKVDNSFLRLKTGNTNKLLPNNRLL